MTVEELIQECTESINDEIFGGPDAKITIFIPGRMTNSGRKKFMNTKGSPIGQCVTDDGEGNVLVAFKAQEILDFLKKNLKEEKP